MTPKDWIVYIEKKTNKTRACLAYGYVDKESLEKEGHKVIGYTVSAGTEQDAIIYADQVLR